MIYTKYMLVEVFIYVLQMPTLLTLTSDVLIPALLVLISGYKPVVALQDAHSPLF